MRVERVSLGKRFGVDGVERRARAPWPSSSAASNASWSTSEPRAMFTMCAPGLIVASALASIRWYVSGVAGAAMTTWSDCARSSSSVPHSSISARSCAAAWRRNAMTRMSNASGASRHLGANRPHPYDTDRLPREHVERCETPALGRLRQPGVGQPLGEREHRGEHELGDGDRVCAPGAGEHPVVHDVERKAVDTGAERVEPADARHRRPLERVALDATTPAGSRRHGRARRRARPQPRRRRARPAPAVPVRLPEGSPRPWPVVPHLGCSYLPALGAARRPLRPRSLLAGIPGSQRSLMRVVLVQGAVLEHAGRVHRPEMFREVVG